MYKSSLLVALTAIATIPLASCAPKQYSVVDYKTKLDFSGDKFKIVQLTDLHIAIQTDWENVKGFIREDINDSDPDLLVFTGDTFMDSTKQRVNEFFSFIDSFNVPFAFTYGNHDFQGIYDLYYISDVIKSCKNSVYVDYDDDNLTGLTNYYINIDKDGKTIYRLYIIDSNSYYRDGLRFRYDIIHEDQINHVENIALEEGKVTSLAFFHIPLYEYSDAYDLYLKDEITGDGENREKSSYGYKRTDAFDRFKAVGVKGIFVGHDHINYSDLVYEDVVLSYGVKSSEEIYNDNDILGYKSITLNESGTFDISNVKNHFRGTQK